MFADADQREPAGRRGRAGQPVEVPDQNELIEEIVLEPEDHLVELLPPVERGIPVAQRAQHPRFVFPAAVGQMRGPDRAQRLIVERQGHRTVVKRVGPDGELPRDAGLFERNPGGISVEHVKDRHPTTFILRT